MEKDDEFLHTYFNHMSQLAFDKAKEHLEKDKETNRQVQTPVWTTFCNCLQQLIVIEKSYIEIGFLQTKNKGFLRKDNSLRSVYESVKGETKKVEENCKQSVLDRQIANYCQNIIQFLNARINLIDFYEKIYSMGMSRQLKYNELLIQIETIIQRHALSFIDISLTPAKAVFNLECEILEHLFKALMELQRLKFIPSLALIHGVHTRLAAWESKMQNKETWKLGFLKNSMVPALFQWLQRFKSVVLSKFSLYFHDTLAQQSTGGDMRQLCSRLQHDHYQKMVNFLKKNDATSIFLVTDNQVTSDTTNYENFPVIAAYPRTVQQTEAVLEMIKQSSADLLNLDKVVYRTVSHGQNQYTYILATVEPSIYLVIVFDNKKTEKDAYISNFISEFCVNLRCLKVFVSLKSPSK